MYKRKTVIAALQAGLFLLGTGVIFPQATNTADEMAQRGAIPEELLRPRRDEAPRYPVDTVIGPLGPGRASEEAYRFARNVGAALLAANTNAPALSSANKVFLENCLSALRAVSPRLFRLGSGREEPDGSVSFLVRFAGREEGITGELFVRVIEQHPPRSASNNEPDLQENTVQVNSEEDPPPEESPFPEEESLSEENASSDIDDDSVTEETEPPPPPVPPVVKIWIFEDLILEEPRSREAENRDSGHRYDFSPYERFF